MGDTFSTVGISFSTVGDNINTVKVAQYNLDKDVKYYEFERVSISFPEVISLPNQIDHIAGLKC